MIALHDADKTNFPNLALMKLSAWFKSQGQEVEMWQAGGVYDKVFSAKVFTFTPETAPEGAYLGGHGRGNKTNLPENIEHICPDYGLYGLDYSLGFLTRGCPRKCHWCIVPSKEGEIRAHADVEEFLRHKEVVLMDNNVLAHDHGLRQIEKMAGMGVKVDFNQGLDARLIDDAVARRLAKLKWRSPVRLACDAESSIEPVRKAVELLRWHNVTPRAYFVYTLVKDIPEAVQRIKFLKGMKCDPFAQPFIPPDGSPPTKEQKWFARWVNHKAVFNTVTWDEYLETQLTKDNSKSEKIS